MSCCTCSSTWWLLWRRATTSKCWSRGLSAARKRHKKTCSIWLSERWLSTLVTTSQLLVCPLHREGNIVSCRCLENACSKWIKKLITTVVSYWRETGQFWRSERSLDLWGSSWKAVLCKKMSAWGKNTKSFSYKWWRRFQDSKPSWSLRIKKSANSHKNSSA